MPLSALKVLELNKKHNLVENLSERELENSEGVGLEMRVDSVYKTKAPGCLKINERTTPEIEKIEPENGFITMKPGQYYLVKTIEKVNVPNKKIRIEQDAPKRYLMPVIYPRSTLQRCGISLYCTTTNPGYSGQLTFGLKNNSEYDFYFEIGSRMFKLVFESVIGNIKRSYSGQHQGGRITSNGKTEKQN